MYMDGYVDNTVWLNFSLQSEELAVRIQNMGKWDGILHEKVIL